VATSILRSFTFRAEKANPALFRALGETTDASKSGRILRFSVVHQAAKTALAVGKAPTHSNTKSDFFHFMHTVKAAEPESIRQPALATAEKTAKTRF
jgi:hypothetical protein